MQDISFFPNPEGVNQKDIFDKSKDVLNENYNINDTLEKWIEQDNKKYSFFYFLLDVFPALLCSLIPFLMLADALDLVDKSEQIFFTHYACTFIGLLTGGLVLSKLANYYLFTKDKIKDLFLKNVDFQKALLNKMNDLYCQSTRYDINIINESEFNTTLNNLVSSFSSKKVGVKEWEVVILFFKKFKSIDKKISEEQNKINFIEDLNFEIKDN